MKRFAVKETHLGKKSHKNKTQKQGHFSGALNYLRTQEEKIKESQVKQFSFFILGFLIFYLLISWALSLAPDIAYESAAGIPLQTLLGAQGISTTSGVTEAGDFFFEAGGKTIIISWLCSGVMEIVVLVSAMLASFGVAWKKKGIGIVIAAVSGYLFNLLRIWVTTNIILTQNLQTIELAHDILFRVVLFLYIMVVYVAWFYWAATKEERKNIFSFKK